MRCITLYGVAHQQEEGQQALLLCRREWPRRRQAPDRAANLSWNRRPFGRSVEGTHRPCSGLGDNPRVWSSWRTLVSRSAFRRLGSVEVDVACRGRRPLNGALPAPGAHPPHLSAWTKDRSCRLVPIHHFAIAVGVFSRAFPLTGFL